MALLDQHVSRELDGDTYARGHGLFEARSDQRELIQRWLEARLALRSAAPALSVLAVGCGDGSLDAPVAERACAAAAPGAVRRWTGVDPHPPSVAAFARRLGALQAPCLQVTGNACTFAELPGGERHDVVTFVHSLYYVGDVAVALRDAVHRLAPGGELLVVHAPLGALNQLAARHAPVVDGHAQSFSEAVAVELAQLDVAVEQTELAATVDLTGAAGADPALLGFTVQATLDDDARAEVLAELDLISEDGPGLRVPHPVTAFVCTPR